MSQHVTYDDATNNNKQLINGIQQTINSNKQIETATQSTATSSSARKRPASKVTVGAANQSVVKPSTKSDTRTPLSKPKLDITPTKLTTASATRIVASSSRPKPLV